MNTHLFCKSRSVSVSVAVVFTLAAIPAVSQIGDAWSVSGALEQLSDQARGFDTATARVRTERKDRDGAVIRSESGVFYVNEDGDIRFDVEGDEPRVILVADRSVFIYEPARQLVEEFPLNRHEDRLEPYAALGFSDTGEELERDYLITILGEEQTGSRRLLGFELTPKSDETRAVIARLALWIDQSSWLPVSQEIVAAQTGERLTVSYDRTARNLPLDSDLFRARWPREVERVRR